MFRSLKGRCTVLASDPWQRQIIHAVVSESQNRHGTAPSEGNPEGELFVGQGCLHSPSLARKGLLRSLHYRYLVVPSRAHSRTIIQPRSVPTCFSSSKPSMPRNWCKATSHAPHVCPICVDHCKLPHLRSPLACAFLFQV